MGILGILKAGGAYVPLDPAYPRERVRFMLVDSGVSVVVTEAAFVDDFSGFGASLVVVDGGLGEAQYAGGARDGPLARDDVEVQEVMVVEVMHGWPQVIYHEKIYVIP